MGVKRGPKPPAVMEPLVWSTRAKGVKHFELFCRRYLVVPKGKGAGKAFKPRGWQLDMLAGVFECVRGAHTNVFVLPRGNGKSGLIAAVVLHHLFTWGEGARVLVAAQNEGAAQRLLNTAKRMIELNPDLSERAQVYKDRIYVPGRDSTFIAVASELNAIEGEDLSLAVIDEVGQTMRDVFESALLSTGKRERTKMVCIGTPSTPSMRDKSPLLDLVQAARGGDESIRLVEFGAPEDADIKDPAVWEASNPAYGDWLTDKTFRDALPPKTSEAEFRRARLGQWITQTGESFIPAKDWGECGRKGVKIPPGTPVVLSLDGSRRWDATVIMIASIGKTPHLELGGFWWNESKDPDYQVNHEQVEERFRELSRTYAVREIIADPAYWSRSLQILDREGYRVGEFPQNGSRMPKAAAEYRAAVLGHEVTHEDNPTVNKHMLAAQQIEGKYGIKIAKPSKSSHIDCCIASIMAYNRAFWLGGGKKKKKTRSYKR